MTDIIARCLNTVEPCTGFAPLCNSEQHRQRVEETHMARHHHAEPDTDELCAEMVSRHSDEAALVEEAIRACARMNNGLVDQNVVRKLLPPLDHPGVVGSVYRVMRKDGRLEFLDENINDDRRSRNVGKKQNRYTLVDDQRALFHDGRSVTA